jgi:hypothetical protein
MLIIVLLFKPTPIIETWITVPVRSRADTLLQLSLSELNGRTLISYIYVYIYKLDTFNVLGSFFLTNALLKFSMKVFESMSISISVSISESVSASVSVAHVHVHAHAHSPCSCYVHGHVHVHAA